MRGAGARRPAASPPRPEEEALPGRRAPASSSRLAVGRRRWAGRPPEPGKESGGQPEGPLCSVANGTPGPEAPGQRPQLSEPEGGRKVPQIVVLGQEARLGDSLQMALGKLRQKTSRRPFADSAGQQISPPLQILALPCPARPARAKKQSLQKVTPGKGGRNGSARLTARGTGGEGSGLAFLSSGAHRQTAPPHTDVSRGFLRSPFPSWPGRAYSCPQGPGLCLGSLSRLLPKEDSPAGG